MRYHATAESPEMHHVHLLELAQTLLGQLSLLSPDPQASATDAGRAWGGQLAAYEQYSHKIPELTITDLIRHLGERGFTTTRDDTGLCFQRCPFRLSPTALRASTINSACILNPLCRCQSDQSPNGPAATNAPP